MPNQLFLDRKREVLISKGRWFDAWHLVWKQENGVAAINSLEQLSLVDALHWLYTEAPKVRRVPVGVIGPREASREQCALAEEIGHQLGQWNIPMLCGGRDGVMEAACKGCLEAGGLPMALLPGEEWDSANPYVAVPMATGIGPARNALIARACIALIAVGGGYGTMTEMAYGLHFDRPVIALGGAPEVPGALYLDTPEAAMESLGEHLLSLK